MGAKKFSSAEKAAIIMASLGEELAPKIFSQMNSEEVSKIGRSLKGLGRLELSEIEETLNEFLTLLQSPKNKALDAQSFIEKMAKRKGKDGLSLVDSFGPAEYRMRVFERTNPEVLYRVIEQDKPQTLALILSHAPTAFAAGLLKIFNEKLRLDVLIRMAKLQEVDPLLVQELDEHLIRELDKLGHGSSQKIGGIKRVAEILNALNQEAAELLNKISERSPTMASDIQQEMFTFEDLLKLDVRGVQEIVKSIKREALILAMRGASVAMIQKFAAGMSERSAAMFREDIESLGAQKKSDVMSARTQLLDITRSLIESGKVQIQSADNQYV